MEYKVISTGSKGNAVIIGNILMDIGVPYKMLEPYLKDIKYIFITHIHSDHLNMSTFKTIKKKWGHIKIYGNFEVAAMVGIKNLEKGISTEIAYNIGEMNVIPFECKHDVECTGYVFQIGELNIIYATDTYSLENAPSLKYDYLFLESNHDEQIIKKYMNKRSKYGYDVFASAKRHLSTQECKKFYYLNRRNRESILIELHQSSRFY